jgi:hypothetical protein
MLPALSAPIEPRIGAERAVAHRSRPRSSFAPSPAPRRCALGPVGYAIDP